MEALPEADRFSRAELDQILQILSQDRWVVRTEKDQFASYKANKPKRSIWDVLSFGDETAHTPPKPDFRDF